MLQKNGLNLSTPIQYLKGVGPKAADLMKNIGVATIEDMIWFFPRDYEDRRNLSSISTAPLNAHIFLKASVVSAQVKTTKKGTVLFEAELADSSGVIKAIWFNQRFLQRIIFKGAKLFVSGRIEYNFYDRQKNLIVKDYEIIKAGEDFVPAIFPIYPLTEGLFQKKIRALVKFALDVFAPQVKEYVPDEIKKAYHLSDLKEAILGLHFPSDINYVAKYRSRVAFEEFFLFQLGLALRKKIVTQKNKGRVFSCSDKDLEVFLKHLPFELTLAQQRVVKEIQQDMQSENPMNRLVQGDVGSGKTVVAALAIFWAIKNNAQAAVMAPTEILARQHFEKLFPLFNQLGIASAFISSSTPKAEKESILKETAQGKIHLLIGTHALIEEKVVFKDLAFVVIDEQHRFGVLQRSLLIGKGFRPDVLVMTATPIPRSLSLTLYGDLDRSVIDELPPGRQEIKTYYISKEKRASSYEFMRQKMKEGQQVYVVCPLVEESEKLDLKAAVEEEQYLKKEIFPELRIALIHGRLKAEEKDKIMRDFKNKEIDLLVSTSVIEVGIDVENATIMAIEHAERFGLSQLHQLRGRIGRGALASYCFLFGELKSDDAKERIKAMLSTSDGFKLAEIDLRLRGPGDFFGVRQSGLPGFLLADIIYQEEELRQARKAAFNLLEKDPQLKNYPLLKQAVFNKYGEFLQLGRLN